MIDPSRALPSMKDDSTSPIPHAIPRVDLGESAELEDGVIRGNREGLALLRTAIDAALSQGKGHLAEDGVAFREIQLCEDMSAPKGGTSSDRWLVLGCLFMFLTAITIFLFGLVDIARRIF